MWGMDLGNIAITHLYSRGVYGDYSGIPMGSYSRFNTSVGLSSKILGSLEGLSGFYRHRICFFSQCINESSKGVSKRDLQRFYDDVISHGNGDMDYYHRINLLPRVYFCSPTMAEELFENGYVDNYVQFWVKSCKYRQLDGVLYRDYYYKGFDTVPKMLYNSKKALVYLYKGMI